MKMTQTVTPFKCNNQPRFSLITIPVLVCARRRIIFMKLKNTLPASALLSATAFSVNAATELTPEQAAAVKPLTV